MIKYFKKAFQITNENLVLTVPFILFLLTILIYVGLAHTLIRSFATLLIYLVTIFAMIVAFLAGWLYMVQQAIELDKIDIPIEDKSKASMDLLKVFPSGVGEYFLSFAGGIIFYVFLALIITFVVYAAGVHFIGKMNFSLSDYSTALKNTQNMKVFLHSMSRADMIKLNCWHVLVFAASTVFSFLTTFWTCAVINKNKNSFYALWVSQKFIFKNFLNVVIFYILINSIYFVVSTANSISAINPILSFVATIVYFYVFVYLVVLVYLYYDCEKSKNIITQQEQEIEQKLKTENNSDSGSDSIGQD